MTIYHILAYLASVLFTWYVIIPVIHRLNTHTPNTKVFSSKCHICKKESTGGAHWECFCPTSKTTKK